MKVAYFTAIERLEIRDEPEPTLTRPGDVLLRIDRVGVCGSDVHYYLRGRIGDQIIEYPATVGHECAGTVMAAGSAVEGLCPGDRVAVDPAIVCGQCDQCRAGRPNTCRKLQFMACPGEAPGAVAEYRVLPGENCFKIPENMTAALAEREPLGLDRVFECSGDPACVDQAQRLLAPGGTLVMVGIPPTPQVSFDVHTMRRNELTFKNVRRQKDCVGPVIEMIATGRTDPQPLLTHRFPLGQIEEAFKLVADYRDGVIKAVIDLGS